MFRRRVLALVVCGLVSATLACSAPTPTAAAPATPTITVEATDCTADGLGALLPAHFTATLVNKTSSRASFAFHRILEGHAYRELELFIAEQQRRFLADTVQLDPPSFTDKFAITTVDPTQTQRPEVTLVFSGTYGIVCREQRGTAGIWPAYLIGPFRVP